MRTFLKNFFAKKSEKSVTENVNKEEKWLFSYNHGVCEAFSGALRDVEVEEAPSKEICWVTTALAPRLFAGHNVEYVTLPETITTIGEDCFSNCVDLQAVNIPNGVTEIPSGCFYGCKSMRLLILPDNLKVIGSSAFQGCANLRVIVLPSSLAKLNMYAFSGCSKVEVLRLPANNPEFKSIPMGCFNDCGMLKSVEIPGSVTSIQDYAFAGCVKLESITGGVNVQDVKLDSFQNVPGKLPFYY